MHNVHYTIYKCTMCRTRLHCYCATRTLLLYCATCSLMLSSVLFVLLLLCILDKTQCNMQHALWCSAAIALQQITRMFAPQWVALMACWGPLCLGDNDNDIANVSISIETPLLNVIRLPSQLGRQRLRHCQCLNLCLNAPPQCHQTAPAQTLQWHDVVAQSMCRPPQMFPPPCSSIAINQIPA